jgi:hypothetical protein
MRLSLLAICLAHIGLISHSEYIYGHLGFLLILTPLSPFSCVALSLPHGTHTHSLSWSTGVDGSQRLWASDGRHALARRAHRAPPPPWPRRMGAASSPAGTVVEGGQIRWRVPGSDGFPELRAAKSTSCGAPFTKSKGKTSPLRKWSLLGF